MFGDKDLTRAKLDVRAEMMRLEAASTAKEVAGKAIGKWGLLAITLIVLIGVIASIMLDEGKIAAVIGLVSAVFAIGAVHDSGAKH